jgi:HEAT repeat protein
MLLGKSGNEKALKQLWWTLSRQSSENRVIYQTAEAIAMIGDREIYPKLWAMLISAYADVRVMGVRAMGALGGAEARGALTTSLKDDIVEVRLAAAEQLAVIGDNSGEKVVIDVFRKKLDAGLEPQEQQRIRVFAARAIGRLASPGTTKYLPQLLDDPSKSVRLAAARAVLQTKTP